MLYARQSTAIIVTVGPVLDADGVAVTGGVVADLKISKNGGAPAALNASATLTHRHTGFYSLSLTATDVNTVGTAEVVIDDTVNACPMKEITVVEPAVYDAFFADTATGVPALAALEATSQSIHAKTTNLPSDPADQSLVIAATDALATLIGDVPTNAELATALGTADDAVLTQVALVKAKTDNLPSDPADASVIAGRFDTLDTSVADLPTNAELATALGTADDAVLAQVALVKAKTDNLPSDPADQSLIIAATDALAALIGDVPTNAELATALAAADDAVLAAIAALNNLSAAQVNAEVLDVLNVDTFAQPGQENPAATTTIRLMLAYLYKAWRNRTTQTSTEYALYADNTTTKDQEAVVSDDGTTFERGEVGTGA